MDRRSGKCRVREQFDDGLHLERRQRQLEQSRQLESLHRLPWTERQYRRGYGYAFGVGNLYRHAGRFAPHDHDARRSTTPTPAWTSAAILLPRPSTTRPEPFLSSAAPFRTSGYLYNGTSTSSAGTITSSGTSSISAYEILNYGAVNVTGGALTLNNELYSYASGSVTLSAGATLNANNYLVNYGAITLNVGEQLPPPRSTTIAIYITKPYCVP